MRKGSLATGAAERTGKWALHRARVAGDHVPRLHSSFQKASFHQGSVYPQED